MTKVAFEGGPLDGLRRDWARRGLPAAVRDELGLDTVPAAEAVRLVESAVPWRVTRPRAERGELGYVLIPPDGPDGPVRYRSIALVRAERFAAALAVEADPVELARLRRYGRAVSGGGADPVPGYLYALPPDECAPRARRPLLLVVPCERLCGVAHVHGAGWADEPHYAPGDATTRAPHCRSAAGVAIYGRVRVRVAPWRVAWGRPGRALTGAWFRRPVEAEDVARVARERAGISDR